MPATLPLTGDGDITQNSATPADGKYKLANSTGAGHRLTIEGSDAGGSNQGGGDIILRPGTGTGTGKAGSVRIAGMLDNVFVVDVNSTDSTFGVQAFIDSLGSGGGTVYFPPGTYALQARIHIKKENVSLFGAGPDSVLTAHASFPTDPTDDLVLVGSESTTQAHYFRLSNLKIDGASKARPINVNGYADHGQIDHVVALNSGPDSGDGFAVIAAHLVDDLTISHCEISGGVGKYGDGIYCSGCTYPKIRCNTISDIERIGIVVEGEGTVKSRDPLIAGNTIFNAHDATDTEANAAIWVENTLGARITANRGYNLTNTPGDISSRGIVLGSGQNEECSFLVAGNTISGAQEGLYVSVTASFASVLVDGLAVLAESSKPYSRGVTILQARAVALKNLRFGDAAFTTATEGLIFADLSSMSADMQALTIEGVSAGTITHSSNDSADIALYAGGGENGRLLSLRLASIEGLSIRMSSTYQPDCVYISNSRLKMRPTSTYAFSAKKMLSVSASQITSEGGASKLFAASSDGLLVLFSGVILSDLEFQIYNGGSFSVLPSFRFCGCDFSGASLTVNATGQVWFEGCRFYQYNSTSGAFKGNYSNVALDVRFSNCTLLRGGTSATIVPIQRWTYDPTTLILDNVTYDANVLTDINQAVGGLKTYLAASMIQQLAAQQGEALRLRSTANSSGDAANISFSQFADSTGAALAFGPNYYASTSGYDSRYDASKPAWFFLMSNRSSQDALGIYRIAPDGTTANYLAIDLYGKVGIGTSSPGATLDVAGDVKTQSLFRQLSTQQGEALRIRSTANSSGDAANISFSQWADSTGAALAFGPNYYASTGGYDSRYDTSKPAWFFLMSNRSSQDALGIYRIASDGTTSNHLAIDSAGKVGIGTSSPGEKLDVNGDAKIQGSTLNLGGVKIIVGTADPIESPGEDAPIGSLYLRTTNGALYSKTGSQPTDWTPR